MSEDRSGNDSGTSWIDRIANAFSSEPRSQEDLLTLLRVARDNEIIDSDALGIIEGAMEVGDLQAREIMIPRSHMQVIKAGQPLAEILPKIIQTAHSRYPVVGENVDEVLGILLAKDLLAEILEPSGEDFDVTKVMRPANLVPESKRLNVLLRDFRESRNHMAIVIDEYGGVAGLITIEDVLEQIVGEIVDETDAEEEGFIKKVADNDYIVKALTPIEDFNEAFDANFSDEEFDTIGGLILKKFGHLPNRTETAVIDGFRFKVLNADNRQVHLLRMRTA